MPVPGVITKRPNESLLLTFDFQYQLAVGETINGVVTIAQDSVDPAGGSAVTISGATHNSAARAQARFAGGQDGYLYKIICRVTTTDGNTREDVGQLRVEDYP